MDLLLMFIMMWRELERPYPTLCYFPTEQAEGRMLNFSRCVHPQPDILSRDYIQGLCMFVKISRRLVIPAFSQHVSKSFLPCMYSKSDTHWKCPLHMVCTLAVNLMWLVLLCICPPVDFHKRNKLDVSQTFWIYCACSDHLCNTCTTGPQALRVYHNAYTTQLLVMHFGIGGVQNRIMAQIRNHAFH